MEVFLEVSLFVFAYKTRPEDEREGVDELRLEGLPVFGDFHHPALLGIVTVQPVVKAIVK